MPHIFGQNQNNGTALVWLIYSRKYFGTTYIRVENFYKSFNQPIMNIKAILLTAILLVAFT